MKSALKIALGIVTSMAGFLEVGSISTAAQAGAAFRFRLLWAILAATICLIALVEMSGRLAASSGHTVSDAVRERFGFRFSAVPLAAEIVLDTLVLAAEIGGAAVAIELATSVGREWWILPIAFAAWLLLWRGSFGLIENGISLLGLVSLAFVVGAVRMHPGTGAVASGLVPTLPPERFAKYGLLAVSILGATVSPYLVNFYASGAVEERWKPKDIPMNRVVAVFGMGFGSVVNAAVLVCAAVVLAPRGVDVQTFRPVAETLLPVFGRWGVPLFAAILGFGCFGAALEVALNLAYAVAQQLGWNWGEDVRPKREARFALVYTAVLALSALVIVSGIPPMKLTMISMALTVLVQPIIVFPFLVIMNDPLYVGRHGNGLVGNAMVVAITAMGALMAVVAIPLEIFGS
ncbi:MAG TPA: divalent metal cation transporter [Thermoanaerobaculia bacterium]|nr:divalent metal cation transporter [Thermoanaerobaculia bacterium]